MKILFLLFCPPLMAQTLAIPIPPLVAPLPAVVDPGQSFTINVPKNGGAITVKLPARTLLAAGQTTTAASSTSIPAKYTLSCPTPALPSGQPDLTKPVNCTITAVK